MKFAFLVHPLSQESRSLLAVDPCGRLRKAWGGDVFQFCRQLRANMRHAKQNAGMLDDDVRVIDEYTELTSGNDSRVNGRLYEIPMDAMQILEEPARALQFMESAVDQAAAWGAQIVGLGSMTGIIGSQGHHLADRGPVAVTTGNSLTVFSARQNLLRACEVLGIDLSAETIAVVGIPGSISTALATLIAPLCKSIVCVARSESGRARQVAQSVDARLVTDIESAAKMARIMITATSSGDCIDQRWLLPGTMVIDVAVPTDVQGSQPVRDDILVLTGGMMKVPENMSWDSMFIGFNHGMIPSCFGETMILGLENRSESFSLGRNLCLDGVLEIGSIAQEHKFNFSHLMSFGVRLSDRQIAQFQKWLYRSKQAASAKVRHSDTPEFTAKPTEANRSNSRQTDKSHQTNGRAASNGCEGADGVSGAQGRCVSAGETFGTPPSPADLSDQASEQHERYINPVLVGLGKKNGFLKTFVRGQGNHVFDKDGNQYLDFVSGFGSLNLGHNHPHVTAAIETAIQSRAPGFAQASINPYAAALANRLIAAAPIGLEMLSFANSGSEAIEAAIKLVRANSSRQRILHCHGSYHGKTLGALSLTGNRKFQQPFEPLIANTEGVDFGDVSRLQETLRSQQYAAFFVEPIQCEGGMNVAPPEYLRQVESICRETGTLFVLDEIQTGLGRTGKMFFCDHDGVSPDIMTVAKSLGGGLVPCGAMLCRQQLWLNAYGSVDNFLLHTSTFSGGSLASAAGLATLDVLEKTDLIDNCRQRSRQLREGLRLLACREDVICEVRGRGLLFGIEFNPTRDKIVRHFAGHDRSGLNHFLAPTALEAVRHLSPLYVMQTLLDEFGIYTQVARSKPSVLRVQPPLGITESEIDQFLVALEECCDELSLIIRTTDMMLSKSVMGNADTRRSVPG